MWAAHIAVIGDRLAAILWRTRVPHSTAPRAEDTTGIAKGNGKYAVDLTIQEFTPVDRNSARNTDDE